MIDHRADVAVIGSGFAGSLTALALDAADLSVVLVDNGVHPRFAVGESSTPIADGVLRDVAATFGLTRLKPMSRYGSWRAAYPEMACGLKRGFSYFQHVPGRPFEPSPAHSGELLVTASGDDEIGDTHWFRADVDAFLAGEAVAAGIPLLDSTRLDQARETGGGLWRLEGERDGQPLRIRARFVIDASGPAGFLRRSLQIPDRSALLRTRSRAIYGHFRHVPKWRDALRQRGGRVDEHPFDCDAAALHHLLEGGWMWVLRFDHGVTSIGLVLDESRHPLDERIGIESEWSSRLERYPSLRDQLAGATIVDPPGRLVRTRRLNRLAGRSAGRNWVMLPHAAGFVDPLHSTGIAHSLCAVERLVAMLAAHLRPEKPADSLRLERALREYDDRLAREFRLIDRLVHGCYRALPDFRLFAACSMLYFAAATTYERRRAESGRKRAGAFLCADDDRLCTAVNVVARRLDDLLAGGAPTDRDVTRFEETVAEAIRPFNRVGLCEAAARNMYRYTAAAVD